MVSGPTEAIQKFAQDLEKQQVPCRLLHTSHAFHSAMMDPMLESFRAHLVKVPLRRRSADALSLECYRYLDCRRPKPRVPTIGRHTCETPSASPTVSRNYSAIRRRVFLEVGPGQALTSLARQHPAKPKSCQGPVLYASSAGTDSLMLCSCLTPWDNSGSLVCQLTGTGFTLEALYNGFRFPLTHSSASAFG